MTTGTPAGCTRFGAFELDRRTGELWKDGRKIKLQEQPFRVLDLLLAAPGEVVTREQLHTSLWAADTFVDFEDGLNAAIRKLRQALDDSAENPRFIQTLPRRGYRFIAPVGEPLPSVPASLPETRDPSPLEAIEAPSPPEARPRFHVRIAWTTAAVVAAGLLAVLVQRLWPSSPAIQSLAVLPFANLSGDPAQEYFADALTDELTSDLAKVSALRVISRTSAMQYKSAHKTVPEIGRDLNVDGVIEGSVLRSGDRVRITAQLISARTDRHFWSDSYERDLKDVLALQNEVARAIVAQVRAAVTPAERERLSRPQSVTPEAYDAYLRGRYYLDKWTSDGAGEGLRYFQRAIEKDSHYALAYVGVAECYIFGVPGVPYKQGHERAFEAASKALELNADMGEPHAMIANVRMFRDWDFAGAEREFKQSIALSPNYGPAHHWYSHFLMDMGRFDESLVESKKLIELDPISPAANLHLGDHYLASRQWDLAIAQELKTLQMDPNYVEAHRQLGEAYLGKRMYREAIAELNRAVDLTRPAPDYQSLLANVYAQSGNVAAARDIVAQLEKQPSTSEDRAAILSYAYAGLGDNDKTFAMFNEAYRQHVIPMDFNYGVEFDPLRADPRFRQLICQIGLGHC